MFGRPIPDKSRDPMRAVFLSLLVLAQLLLPAAFERAGAAAPQQVCLAQSGGAPTKAPAHAHDQCAQCCPQQSPTLFPATGPEATPVHGNISPLPRVSLARSVRFESRGLPPPTGPPSDA